MDNLENNENMNENIDETNENINEEAIDEAYEKEIEAENWLNLTANPRGWSFQRLNRNTVQMKFRFLKDLRL